MMLAMRATMRARWCVDDGAGGDDAWKTVAVVCDGGWTVGWCGVHGGGGDGDGDDVMAMAMAMASGDDGDDDPQDMSLP